MIYCYPLIILREIGDAFVSSFVFPLKGNMIYLDIRYSIFMKKNERSSEYSYTCDVHIYHTDQ